MNFQSPACLLCGSAQTNPLQHRQYPQRHYFHCQICDMIFLSEAEHSSRQAEKTRYEQHNNDPADLGYRNFLKVIVKPAMELWNETHSSAPEKVLDYGCGPGPVLGELFTAEDSAAPGSPAVWSVEKYDPYFFPKDLRGSQWDVIVCTEVWEHFRNPNEEIEKQVGLLKPNSILAVMTQFHQGPEHFQNWWYARDFTHVVFYSGTTLKWIAQKWNLKMKLEKNPVVLFER